MIVVVGPEIELACLDPVVWIGICDTRLHRPRPRLANRNDRLDGSGGGRLVVTHAHVSRHDLNRLAEPGAFLRIRLVGA